jgi:ATP-dependent DNA helicase PIF1
MKRRSTTDAGDDEPEPKRLCRDPHTQKNAEEDVKRAVVAPQKESVAEAQVWNAEQLRALELFEAGHNLFLTGAAGTGKTRLLCEMKRRCVQLELPHAITATTGIAAVQVGGTTINSWAGIGLGTADVHQLLSDIQRRKHNKRGSAFERWTKTRVLFIDEISMMSSEMFAKLNQIACSLRARSHRDRPFGGLQIVVLGDFYQLGAIDREADQKSRVGGVGGGILAALAAKAAGKPIARVDPEKELARKYLFRSPTWESTIDAVVLLRRIYRQKDASFVELLMRARNAQLTDADVAMFHSKLHPDPNKRPLDQNGLIRPLLHARRAEVDDENVRRLRELRGRCWRVDRVTHHVHVRHLATSALKSDEQVPTEPPAPETRIEVVQAISKSDSTVQKLAEDLAAKTQMPHPFFFKVGAAVLLLVNLDVQARLVNGLRGTIIAVGPNRPAHSVTAAQTAAHSVTAAQTAEGKANSSTIMVESAIDDGEVHVLPTNHEAIWVKFEGHLEPLCLGRHVSKHCLIDSEQSKPEKEWTEYIQTSQFPLTLAWGITIHKSQGQTLTAAHLSLGNEITQPGQAYVALSRLASISGMTVSRFSRRAFRTDPVVRQYYEILEEAFTSQ